MNPEEFKAKIKEIAYKPISEFKKEDEIYYRMERDLCSRNIFYFARYAKLLEPPTMIKQGGVIPFELWEHLRTTIKSFLIDREISILKSRQIGISWTVALYFLWGALFKQGFKGLMYSKGELEAIELLDKVRTMYKQLPPFLQISIYPDSGTEMGFPTMMSRILALPSTEEAGVSFTASVIAYDEHNLHNFDSKNYSVALPTIGAGGQVISIFTAYEDKLDSLAVSLFKGGLEGTNSFKSLFFPYTVRPGRDDVWYQREMRKLTPGELKGLTPELYMARAYPKTIEEALTPSKTIAVFIREVLDAMMTDTRNPITVPGLDPNIIHIYKPFNIGEVFICGTDTSHGVGKDYAASVVLNVRTGEVAADIYNNTLSPENLAHYTFKMLEDYKNPLWYIENNEWGRSTINVAEKLGYKNLGYEDDRKKQLGWNTQKTREVIWGELIPAINTRQITVYNELALKSFYDIIRVAEKNGRIEASRSGHDDYQTALAIAWFNRSKANATQKVTVKSYTYKE